MSIEIRPVPTDVTHPGTLVSIASGSLPHTQPATLGSVAIRRLRAADVGLLRAHLKRLDSETRRLRFGNAVNDYFLDRYAELALGSDARVLGCFIDGTLRGLAELRFLAGAREDAEAAFSLEKDFQSRGLGEELFGRIVAAARNRGVRRLFLTCLRENRRMQAIAAKHGAELSFASGDVTAEIRRPYADAKSLAREFIDEGEAFVFGLLEWRRKRFAFLGAFFGLLAGAFGFSPSIQRS